MVTPVNTDKHRFSDKAMHVSLHGEDSDGSGNISPVQVHHGKLHIVDYKDAIGIGEVAGHSIFRGFGRRDSLSTGASGDDVWEGSAVTIPYPNQSIGEQVVIVSTSANDAAAGSGVRQIEIHYLDATGNEQMETVTMNGTTPVNSATTNIRFIQYIHASSVGSFGASAAGDITIYKVANPATVYSMIHSGQSVSLSSHRMVPFGKTLYLNYVAASSTSSKAVSVRLTATCDDYGMLTTGIFLFNELFELQDSAISVALPVPRKFPALTIIKGSAISALAGGSAALSYGGYIE
jgi:hypothetical protein